MNDWQTNADTQIIQNIHLTSTHMILFNLMSHLHKERETHDEDNQVFTSSELNHSQM